MTQTSSIGPSSLNQGSPSSNTDQEHPKLGRFEQIKKGILGTLRAHPYLVVTAVTSLALIAIFRRIDVMSFFETKWHPDWEEVNPQTYTCISCLSVQPVSHRPWDISDGLHWCRKCDVIRTKGAKIVAELG
jgi:hypothetical protein